MKSRYDRAPGKEAAIAKVRQNRYEMEHREKNDFVKKVQNEQAVHGGRVPNLKAESMEFSSYMCNDGMHAQELARDLTANIDHIAFPVKPAVK